MHAEHKTCLPFLSKESNPSRLKSRICFASLILLKGIQVQEGKSVVCNQCSSSAISGLQSRGGERWHNYRSVFCALSSVNAECVMLGKPRQACWRPIVNRASTKEKSLLVKLKYLLQWQAVSTAANKAWSWHHSDADSVCSNKLNLTIHHLPFSWYLLALVPQLMYSALHQFGRYTQQTYSLVN